MPPLSNGANRNIVAVIVNEKIMVEVDVFLVVAGDAVWAMGTEGQSQSVSRHHPARTKQAST